MNIYSLTVFLLVTLLIPVAQAEQTCRSDLSNDTPTSRFMMDGNNGTVTDGRTSMVWLRCALGQMWNGEACEGVAKVYSWHEARAAIEKINATGGYGGHDDWRLPLVPNLASIVDRRCLNPRINAEVFPATALGPFWSSMEKMGAPKFAYVVDFGAGNAGPLSKENKAHVRAVRGEPWWVPPQMP